MGVREAFLSKLRHPVTDLLARVLGEEPVQLGAVPILQGALDDERRRAVQVEGGEVVFLEEGCMRGWDGPFRFLPGHPLYFR
jgi:hypothetical protein